MAMSYIKYKQLGLYPYSHRIHGAWGILMGSMLPYIAYMILWVMGMGMDPKKREMSYINYKKQPIIPCASLVMGM